jgi:putative ABC transport system substrate-binding protein
MKRRAFITLLGGAAAGWPLATRAQQAVRRIGVLMAPYAETDSEGHTRIAAFLKSLHEHGWDDGRNVRIEVRWPAASLERTKAHAAELVALAPDVIVASTNIGLAVLHELNKTISTVFVQVSDPVGSGFVSGIARPGGNTTGFQSFQPEMGGKWLGVLKEAIPTLKRVAVLTSPTTSTATAAFQHAAETVAPSLGIQVTGAAVGDGEDIERVVTAFASQGEGGLIVPPHPVTVRNRNLIIALAARHRLPAIYPFRYFATGGGLLSYGFDQIDLWRGAAGYVDRILRGEKAAELPVQAPTKFQLVVNLSTAKALGFDIPASFSLRADEVIE